MSSSSFAEHAEAATAALRALVGAGEARLVNLTIEARSTVRGLIGGVVAFDDDSELHFREFVDVTQPEPRLMYAYHYQDRGGALVFRYDNAAHRPPLSQVEHKHTTAGIVLQEAPSLTEVLDEILDLRR